MTDSSIRNVMHVLIDRKRAWRVPEPDGATAATLAKRVASGWPGTLADRIGEEAFERTVQLYLHVLKERLTKEDLSESSN